MKKRNFGNVKFQVTPRRVESIPIALFIIIFTPGLIMGISQRNPVIVITFLLVAALVSSAVKISRQWEKAVVLRLGKFQKLSGPGLFLIIPLIDTVSSWVDQRIITTPFNAEQTLTKDTVPVDVDAVLFLDGVGCRESCPGSGRLQRCSVLGSPNSTQGHYR